MNRVPGAYFDGLYERSRDPWNFAGSAYERAKYSHTARVLGPTGRLLEIGCSIGVLTGILACQSGQVVGVDVSQRAIDLAREELAGESNVTLTCARFPESLPEGPWDAVLCSEVLYYLDPPGLEQAEVRLRACLSEGARVLLVHWRLPAPSNPLQGDQVHDRLVERLGPWHARDERRPQYRMDLFRG